MTSPASDPQLRRWYLKFNAKWFGSELPEANVTLQWESVGGDVAEITEYEGGTFILRVDPAVRWDKKQAQFTLLHEMVHLKLWPKHRKHTNRFHEEMERLAREGAFRPLW